MKAKAEAGVRMLQLQLVGCGCQSRKRGRFLCAQWLTLNWAVIKNKADLPVCCSVSLQLLGRQCAWTGCFREVLSFCFPHLAAFLSSGISATVVLPGRNRAFSCSVSLCFCGQFCGDLAFLKSASLGKVLFFFLTSKLNKFC